MKDLLLQMEEGLKTADPHDYSTYTGWTGIALLYLQLHRVSSEASHLQRALDYVKRTLRSLSGRRVTFLCGDAGPLAVGAVIHHRLDNGAESKECISKLLQLQRSVLSPDSDVPDELLYGRAGYLYALLYVNKEIGPDTVDEATIAKVSTPRLRKPKMPIPGSAVCPYCYKGLVCPPLVIYRWSNGKANIDCLSAVKITCCSNVISISPHSHGHSLHSKKIIPNGNVMHTCLHGTDYSGMCFPTP
ncbi:hypothetical protein ACEWY4_018691 [Coilia grayii]|uniref:LanC-like protein 2 n=1 Tax=Coilia grayii TaxID=363190 RepID=A0ABD1JGY6_9TELE